MSRLDVRGLLLCLVLTAAVCGPAGTAATAASAAAGTSAPNSLGIGLLDVPSAARDDPRARVYIVDHLPPGAVIHRRLEVANTTAGPLHVELYPAAATITDGSFVGAGGRTGNALTGWTTLDQAAFDLAAGGTRTATVTISVPTDAAPGEQYGVLWAETASPAGAVVQVSRVGVRLYVHVGGGNPPAADFSIAALTARRAGDGSPTVVATVRNTGGRAIDMSGSLALSAGPAGLSAGPFPAQLGTTLAPGQVEPVTVTLDKRLPAGPWNARITLRSGLVERTAEATITFPDSGTAAPVPARTRDRPTWQLLVVVGVAALLLGGLLIALLRRRRRSADEAADYPPPLPGQLPEQRLHPEQPLGQPVTSQPAPRVGDDPSIRPSQQP